MKRKSFLKLSIIIIFLLLVINFEMKTVYAVDINEMEGIASDNIVKEDLENADENADADVNSDENANADADENDESDLEDEEIWDEEIEDEEIEDEEIEDQEIEDEEIEDQEIYEEDKQQASILSTNETESAIPHTGLKEKVLLIIGSILIMNIIRILYKIKLMKAI